MTKLEAVRNGVYPRGACHHVPLREVADPHLVNALLQALSRNEEELARELVLEVRRRGIQQLAYDMAAVRTGQVRR